MATPCGSQATVHAEGETAMTSDELLRKALENVLKDDAFKLPGPSTAAALNTASTLLTWSAAHHLPFATFAEQLVGSLRVCFTPHRSWKTQKEKLWGTYHSIRVSTAFTTLWNEFLQKSIGHPAHPSFYQHVSDLVLKDMVSTTFQASTSSSTSNSPARLTHEEECALRYVAGYVCRKVRCKLETLRHGRKDDMILFIMELNGDEMEVDDVGGTESWCNLIDRGGLWHVSDTAYGLFYIFEEELRRHLTMQSASKMDEGSKQRMINAVLANEDLLFQWCMVSVLEKDEVSLTVLRMLVEQYVTIRGFAFATSCLEKYKQAAKKTSQKSKGIRKELFTSKVSTT